MLLFSPDAGRLQVIRMRANYVPATIRFPGFGYDTLQAAILSTRWKFTAGYQLTDTLGPDTTLLTFDENAGPGVISGMIFDDVCLGTGAVATGVSGVERVIGWWKRHNMSRAGDPVTIVLGYRYPVRAYVADLDISIESVKDRIWTFSMAVIRVPERSADDEEEAFNDVAAPGTAPAAAPGEQPNAGGGLTNVSPSAGGASTGGANTGGPNGVLVPGPTGDGIYVYDTRGALTGAITGI